MRGVVLSVLMMVGSLPACVEGPDSIDPEPVDVEDLTKDLAPIRDQHGVPGLAGAIVGLDGVEAMGAVGFRRDASGPLVTVDDAWHLGSDTKAMTATLLAIQVAGGVVRWEPVFLTCSATSIRAGTTSRSKIWRCTGVGPSTTSRRADRICGRVSGCAMGPTIGAPAHGLPKNFSGSQPSDRVVTLPIRTLATSCWEPRWNAPPIGRGKT